MPESLKARVRIVANRLLNPLGLHLIRRERAFEMDGLIGLAARNRIPVRTWIDVGASDGSWSLRARRHYPAATFVLFEPLAERLPALRALHHRHGFIVVPAVAGAAPGQASFCVSADLDGSGVAHPGASGARRDVPVETVGRVIASRQLPAPYALKLDTHGAEIAVLEGAASLLPQVSLLVIEAYNFQLGPGCLRFHELCAWLEAAGFRCWNLADPLRRPSDGVLWQMDLAFAPAASPLFACNGYA